MKEVGKLKSGSMLLQVQPRLDHRSGFGPDVASLFPPPGTFEALCGAGT
jgi:hypothetical protein